MHSDFPVTEYSGTKSILISTRTVVGGKNPFMGIAYVIVGGICIVLGTLFTVAHLVKPRYDKYLMDPLSILANIGFPRKLGDHTYLTWNTEPQSTAVTSGADVGFRSHAP